MMNCDHPEDERCHVCACPKAAEEAAKSAQVSVRVWVFMIGGGLLLWAIKSFVDWVRALPWRQIGETTGNVLVWCGAIVAAFAVAVYVVWYLSFVKWEKVGRAIVWPYTALMNRVSFFAQYRELKAIIREHPHLQAFTMSEIAQMALQEDHPEEERLGEEETARWQRAFIKAQQDVCNN